MFRGKKESHEISQRLWHYLKPPVKKELKKGDTIRFGKQTMTLKVLNHPVGKHKSKMKKEEALKVGSQSANELSLLQSSSLECRICLERQAPENPFVHLCECSKSMPMHLGCIKMWLHKKTEPTMRKNMVFYDIKDIKCEVCNHDYPLVAKLNGVDIALFTTTADSARPYASFEVHEINTVKVKNVVVVYLDVPKFKLSVGRSATNNFIFTDISVSRKHAEFIGKSGKIYIRDSGSKFGSHLEFQDMPIVFNRQPILLQMEKFYLKLHPHKRKDCYCNSKKQNLWVRDPVSAIVDIEREFGVQITNKGKREWQSRNTVLGDFVNKTLTEYQVIKEDKFDHSFNEVRNDQTFNQDMTGIYLLATQTQIPANDHTSSFTMRKVRSEAKIYTENRSADARYMYQSTDLDRGTDSTPPKTLSQFLTNNNSKLDRDKPQFLKSLPLSRFAVKNHGSKPQAKPKTPYPILNTQILVDPGEQLPEEPKILIKGLEKEDHPLEKVVFKESLVVPNKITHRQEDLDIENSSRTSSEELIALLDQEQECSNKREADHQVSKKSMPEINQLKSNVLKRYETF